MSESFHAMLTGNQRLLDVHVFLDIQTGADLGTYISNNPSICLDAALSWTRRNDSILEYNLSMVRANLFLILFSLAVTRF